MAYARTADTMHIATPWWLILIQGMLSVLVGILLLFSPWQTTFFIVVFLGAYWLASGIITVVSLFFDREQFGWKLFSGILSILAGWVIITTPLLSTVLVPVIIVIILGVQGVIIGIVNLIQALRGGGWGMGILGTLSIVFGLILLGSPLLTAAVLPWVVGLFAIAGGIATMIYSFRVNRA